MIWGAMGTEGQPNERAVPILPSRDLREALGFYEKLGFENRGAPPEEWNYMILGRGSIELHFIGETTSFAEWTGPTSCHLAVADADALHAEWARAGVTAEGPWTTDYGMREFTVLDPGGNLLRVGSFSTS
jgi:catechol 2,3-dioxygenase-like lactoylglutathione lyase family enzyme